MPNGERIREQAEADRLAAMDAALIDASTMIYLLRAGCLGFLTARLRLFSPPEAIRETGWPAIGVESLDHPYTGLPTDDVLLACSADLNLPLITDDRRLADRAETEGLRSWRALQLIHLLLLRGSIDRSYHAECLRRLMETTVYRPQEKAAGDRLLAEILRRIDPDEDRPEHS